ncbi:DUF4440 domain-containing protein [Methylocystis rosea]|uniref:DUF4440 domain-containing protein n=1 Tax=Methylocystis rosea TaxID=173366 RepID=A0ABX6EJB4_9HYPH|nr:DUF4440 domain-containing protein [Methylocystis rosea]QGM94487.1 DUF4440 domain-containing protein [Methylocystis rosea]
MSNDQEILELIEIWFAALKDTSNPDTVTALYDDKAVLVPTLWNGPCFGKKAIRNYFEVAFLPVEPRGYVINYSIERREDVAINSGHYVFNIKDCQKEEHLAAAGGLCNDDRVEKMARFTFVYRLDKPKNQWLIIAHHSSKMPEEHSTQVIRWVKSESFV